MPSYNVYEDELFYAFLDIFPHVKGHTLVVPKKHYQWVYDVPEFERYWGVTLTITRAIQKALHPGWINYMTYGAVPHAHIHILPRVEGTAPTAEGSILPPKIQIAREELDVIADLIKKQI